VFEGGSVRTRAIGFGAVGCLRLGEPCPKGRYLTYWASLLVEYEYEITVKVLFFVYDRKRVWIMDTSECWDILLCFSSSFL
jgi:hypothetical protein